jgi:hypothetical protein
MERALEDREFDRIQLREEYDILLRESLLMRMLEDNP